MIFTTDSLAGLRSPKGWLIMCAQLSSLDDKVWPFACPPTYPHLVKNVECSSPREQGECNREWCNVVVHRRTDLAFLSIQDDCMLQFLNPPHNRHLWDLIPTKLATLTWVVVWHTRPHSLGYQLCPQQRVSFLYSMLEEEVPAYELLHELAHCSWTSPLQCALYCEKYIYPIYSCPKLSSLPWFHSN